MTLTGLKIFLKINEDFIKSYNSDSDERCFLEVGFQYPENLHNFHDDLPFCLNEWKLKKLKSLYLIYMIMVRLEKMYRIIQFNQKAWLKLYVGINTDLRKKQKIILEKIFWSWWIMQF